MSDEKEDILGGYNPFGDPTPGAMIPSGQRQPAVLPASDMNTEAPPGYSKLDDGGFSTPAGGLLPSSQPIMTVADLERRQAELDARAAQLDLREKQTQQQEAWRVEHGYATAEIHNWPPLPRWCCCKPFVRIDFISDIPPQYCWMVKFAHYLWLAYSLLLLLNIFGTLSYLIVSPALSEAGPLFGVAILCFVFLTPASFYGWNRPVYKAFKKNSSMQFCIFFPIFGAQIIIIIIQLLGINYLGACGWINSLKALSSHKGVGTFMIFLASLYTAAAIAAAVLIVRVHFYYRGSGASARRAKQELARDVIGSSLGAAS